MSTEIASSGQSWSNYLRTCELEEAAFMRFKWLESEREGHDIGYDRADWLWYTRGRDQWLRSLTQSPSSQRQP